MHSFISNSVVQLIMTRKKDFLEDSLLLSREIRFLDGSLTALCCCVVCIPCMPHIYMTHY